MIKHFYKSSRKTDKLRSEGAEAVKAHNEDRYRASGQLAAALGHWDWSGSGTHVTVVSSIAFAAFN